MNRLSSKNMIDIRIVSNYYSGYLKDSLCGKNN